MKLRKALSILAALVLIAGCAGAPVSTVTGTDETTSVLLVGKLLGGTVRLSNGFVHTITKDDLQKSLTNLPSIKDSEEQKQDFVLLNVDPGEIELEFSAADGKNYKRRLFVAPGITNEVKLQ